MKLVFIALLFPVLCVRAQSKFNVKIAERVKHMTCPATNEEDPVSLTVNSVVEGDSIGIVVKVAMAPGWHVYAYVPPTLLYIAVDQILQLPEQVKTAGEWKKTEPERPGRRRRCIAIRRRSRFYPQGCKAFKKRDGRDQGGSVLSDMQFAAMPAAELD